MEPTLEELLAQAPRGELGILCTGEESLRLTSRSADSDAIVTLTGRFQQLGELVPRDICETHTPNTDRTTGTSEFALGRGWLKALTVVASSGSPSFAQTFVCVDIIRGRGNAATVLQTLICGPVSARSRRAWPGSPLVASIEGPGIMRSVTGTNPAAGVEISETVPTGARWRVIALMAALVTDANAATREVALTFDDGANAYARIPAKQTQIASLNRRYSFTSAPPFAGLQQDATINVQLPALILPAGHRIKTIITNQQVGDDWGAPQMLIEEWLEAE